MSVIICTLNQLKEDDMGRGFSMQGENRNAYRLLVGKPLGGDRCRWEDNIKMDVEERGWGDMD
jgi:hypothetical protein